jgi:hypothetical protein
MRAWPARSGSGYCPANTEVVLLWGVGVRAGGIAGSGAGEPRQAPKRGGPCRGHRLLPGQRRLTAQQANTANFTHSRNRLSLGSSYFHRPLAAHGEPSSPARGSPSPEHHVCRPLPILIPLETVQLTPPSPCRRPPLRRITTTCAGSSPPRRPPQVFLVCPRASPLAPRASATAMAQ